MKTQAHFRAYEPNQLLLLPPDMRQWLPEDDLVYFIMDVVRGLNLSSIYQEYDGAKGGQPPYDPRMMVSLLIYAYCVGVASSRRIETATYHSVPFRVLCADQHPDHDTIASFRKHHLKPPPGSLCRCCSCARRWAWSSLAMWLWMGPRCGPTPPSTRPELRPHGEEG